MSLPLRLTAAALALVLAAVSWLRFDAGRRQVQGLRQELLPLLSDDLAAATELAWAREPDAVAARALGARALLADGLRQAARPELARRAALIERLERAQTLATETLAARPASWTAALSRGGAVYLARSLGRDSRLLTEPAAWEGSLALARRLAPGQVEAQRWLALAYLELWAFLPEAKRAETRELVAIGLADPATFDRIIRPWLAIAKDHAAAHALMPAAPFAWERLAQIYGSQADWSGYALARAGHFEAITGAATAAVESAEALLAGGETRGARAVFLGALASLPVDGRFAGLAARILAGLPGGPIDAPSEAALRRWLDWALEDALAGNGTDERRLPATALGRLGGAVPELAPATAALTAVLADDLPRAELIERRKSALGGDAWSRYFLAKARHRLRRGDRAGAEEALARLPYAPEPSLAEVLLREELARAGSNEAARDRALFEALEHRRDVWGPVDWRMSGHTASLSLLPARPASRLVLEILAGPPDGGVVAVRLDGATVAFLPVGPGQGSLELELPLTPQPHRIELLSHATLPVRPGVTRLAGK